jgi:hypothetical protein
VGDRLLTDLIGAVDATAATFDGRGWQVKERWLEMMLEGALRARGVEPLRQLPLHLGRPGTETWAASTSRSATTTRSP